MRQIPPILVSLALAGANAAAADGAAAPEAGITSVGVAAGREWLSNGMPDWSESSLQFKHQFGRRQVVDVVLAETKRFGLRDTQAGAVYSMPLTAALTGTVDANASSTHRVLAKNAVGAALQYEFAPAWLLHMGGRTTSYDAVRVNQPLLMLEHYFSSFSWSAAWRPARAFGTTAHSGEMRASYYYGDKSSIGIVASAGKEAANLGSSVVLADVRSLVLTGHHWLDRRWALNYTAGHTRQGEFYTRNGFNLGVQYAF